MNRNADLTPAALYARVSSDRQDVDLSVHAQLRALRDYAERNGYSVAREYVDEAESGRIADRPQFRRMIDEGAKPQLTSRSTSRSRGAPRRRRVHNRTRPIGVGVFVILSRCCCLGFLYRRQFLQLILTDAV